LALEGELHKQYADFRGLGEWFAIGPTEVLSELKRHTGFVPKPKDSFEIVGFDKNGIPEYLGVCDWANFEVYECCPFCDCFCGLHPQEASGMYHFINCNAFTNFEDDEPPPDDYK